MASAIELLLLAQSVDADWGNIGSGFPSGWSGGINFIPLVPAAGIVFIDWAFEMLSGTVVSASEVLTTALPAGFYYPNDSKIIPGNVTGAGLASNDGYCTARIGSSGGFTYQGPAGTLSGAGFFYGQGVYTVRI